MQRLKQALWLVRSGGPRALVRALFRRFVYRRWRVRLFEDPPLITRDASPWPPGFRFELRDKRDVVSAALEAALRQAGAEGLYADLDRADRYYLVRDGDDIASYGAVFAYSPQRGILGLPSDAVLIGGCATLERHRGRNLYRMALNDTARALRADGISRIFIEVRPENEASIRGVLGAGFIDKGIVDSRIWFGYWIYRDRRIHFLRRGKSS